MISFFFFLLYVKFLLTSCWVYMKSLQVENLQEIELSLQEVFP